MGSGQVLWNGAGAFSPCEPTSNKRGCGPSRAGASLVEVSRDWPCPLYRAGPFSWARGEYGRCFRGTHAESTGFCCTTSIGATCVQGVDRKCRPCQRETRGMRYGRGVREGGDWSPGRRGSWKARLAPSRGGTAEASRAGEGGTCGRGDGRHMRFFTGAQTGLSAPLCGARWAGLPLEGGFPGLRERRVSAGRWGGSGGGRRG